MTSPPASVVGSAAWLELLHAEVCWSLDQRGIDALIIKGPTIAEWLYPGEQRPSADVDILLPPARLSDAVEVLAGRGFEAAYEGTREGGIGGEHSTNMWRLDPELGRHGIDMHHFFPGIKSDPSDAFEVLWSCRVPAVLGGVVVWYPNHPARFVIIALHAAREPNSAKTSEDLHRALAALDDSGLAAAAQLAQVLDCRSALKAGLESRPDKARFIDRLGLRDVSVSPEWRLKTLGADRTAQRLNHLNDVPLTVRPTLLFRLAFPSPALMRIRDPRASEGTWGLTRAYGVRLGQGFRALPGAIRAVREARRRH